MFFARILFDKVHVIRHPGEALDTVRKRGYAQLTGNHRRLDTGQKSTLRPRHERLTTTGRRGLRRG